jgi:ATP-binding cassette subfamily B protein RaxB
MSLPFFSNKPRVRTMLQSEQQECGLACLAMIANAHGHDVDLPYMRSIHQINRGGMSLAELHNLGGIFGLDARGLGVEKIDDLEGVKLPAILHWENRHYVVLEAIKRGRYVIQDPAVGRRVFVRKEFEKHFSGVALEFEPRVQMEKLVSRDEGLTLWALIKSTIGFKAALWKILGVSFAIGLLALATPILLQVALDFVLPQADVDLLTILAIGLCALLIFEAVGGWLRDMVILRTSIGMQLQFSRSVVGHGLRLPLRYFERRQAGDFITRLNSVDQVKAFAADGMVRALADAAVSIISVGLMFAYSVPMTFMVLATLLLALGVRMLYMRRTREATTEALTAKADEVSALLDGLDRIQIIKAHNISGRIERRWFEKLSRYASRDFHSRRLQVDNQFLVHGIVVIGTVATLYAGVAKVLVSEMTIGMLYAFFALRSSFFAMADTLMSNLMQLTVISSHVRRLEDIIQNEPESSGKHTIIRRGIRRDVEVKDVGIIFGEGERPVVESASLRIDVERGERIAIIGESGSGKSSLLKVIASIAPASRGSILVDGQPLSRFGVMEYRANIGAVFAEDGLFNATVAENVSLFDPEVPTERIVEALRLVGLDGEMEMLPQGIATIVANNNTLLSTGQRRRVLAARVICRQPRLMLFDEITANLDADTERNLLECLCKLPGGKIFVTHSERLLGYVDKAYRLKNGVLTEVELPAKKTDEIEASAPIVSDPEPAAAATPAPVAVAPSVVMADPPSIVPSGADMAMLGSSARPEDRPNGGNDDTDPDLDAEIARVKDRVTRLAAHIAGASPPRSPAADGDGSAMADGDAGQAAVLVHAEAAPRTRERSEPGRSPVRIGGAEPTVAARKADLSFRELMRRARLQRAGQETASQSEDSSAAT